MSEFWKRKIRRYFSTFDFDRDGVISKDDYLGMAIRYSKFGTEDQKKAEHLKTQFEDVRSFESFLLAYIARKLLLLLTRTQFANVSFIHSSRFYGASSSSQQLRGAPDKARILCRSFTPKRHR